MLSAALFTKAELSSLDTDHLACTAKNIYHLALHRRKNLLAPGFQLTLLSIFPFSICLTVNMYFTPGKKASSKQSTVSPNPCPPQNPRLPSIRKALSLDVPCLWSMVLGVQFPGCILTESLAATPAFLS